ncbi:winged helix-turn-helix domain-containing protein [Undibacterium sp. Di26W]|uniref:nSTAND1 domain-containing NTPase n=1 Tax=Undibacterium sp. Di26W TaxID=3413035 RepID=UPI003BEFF8C0
MMVSQFGIYFIGKQMLSLIEECLFKVAFTRYTLGNISNTNLPKTFRFASHCFIGIFSIYDEVALPSYTPSGCIFHMKNRIFHFGDWQINPPANTIASTLATRQIEPRAMDVLVALCERANTVVSAEQLLQECWGSNLHGDNPVHKSITQLRRALGDNALSPTYIETIRKRGYRTVAEVHVENAHVVDVANETWLNESPFRGLQAFDQEHAPVFFGRADASFKLLQAIALQAEAGCALVLVLGPSGAGKTSLIQAGLLPLLMGRSSANNLLTISSATFDLGEMGQHHLLTMLGGVLLDWQIDENGVFPGASAVSLAQRIEHDIESVIADMRHALEPNPEAASRLRFALVLDRFEAIFSWSHIGEHERQAFLKAIDTLARSHCVIVVIACRNDFYPRIAEYPDLMEGKPRGAHFDLSPPSHAEIAQMIRLPAAAATLHFGINADTQIRLDDILCESATGSPDALPLLQYTLQELYSRRTADGELSFEAFHQLGGLEGVIGQRAEQTISALTESQRACLPQVLSLVVTISASEDVVTSRRAPWSALRNEDQRRLVNALVESRLFVSELLGDAAGFGVAHEAILRRWPRVTAWIGEYREALRVRDRVAAQSARWVSEGRRNDLLLPHGKQLTEARSLLSLAAFSLSSEEAALIRVSTQKAKLRERILVAVMTLIVILAALAMVLGLSALSAKRVADQKRIEAEGMLGFMLGDFVDKLRPIGKLDLLDSVSAKALEYLSRPGGETLNLTSLTQRAKALQLISEVNIERGNMKAATDALLVARTILQQQFAIAPDDRDVLKNLGANAFWLGRIHMEQGDPAQAKQYFKQYQDYSDRLHLLEPDSVDWWIEQSYAHSSLGSLALARGDARTASAEFLLSIELKTKASSKKPQDRSLKGDLADSISWMGSAKETLGELDAAMALYRRETDLVESLHQAAPNDALWNNRLALALQHQAVLKLALGQSTAALDDFHIAHDLLKLALEQEPSNKAWQRNFLFAKLDYLRIAARETAAKDILPQLQDIWKTTNSLAQRDPKKVKWSLLEAQVRQQMALALLDLHQNQEARRQLTDSQRHLEDVLTRNPTELRSRLALAEGWLILAAVEAREKDEAASQHACQQARGLLAKDAPGSMDYHILSPWIRAQTCLGNDAIIGEVKAQLTQIGYREFDYVRFLKGVSMQVR